MESIAIFFLFSLVLVISIYKISEQKRQNQEQFKSIQAVMAKAEATNNDLSKKCEELLLSNDQKSAKIIDMQEYINDLKSGRDITDEFRLVEKSLRSGKRLVFVHGGAGTGKSTLITWLREKGLIHVVLAPTGLAALNVGGQTIHKFFKFKPFDIFHKDDLSHFLPKSTQNILDNAPTICIDEISMVRADLIDKIDRVLRMYSQKQQPFGGYRMLFVGDLFQLPPIINKKDKDFFDPNSAYFKGEHGWQSGWFLDAEVIRSNSIHRIDLTHVFRQNATGEFAKRLNELRRYQNISGNLDYLNSRIPTIDDPCDSIIVVDTNPKADEYNERKIHQLPGEITKFNAIKTGVFEEYKESDLPTRLVVNLKVGAFVMILHNDPDGAFVNGSTGRILDIGDEFVKVRLKNGSIADIQYHTWESYRTVWNPDERRFVNELDGTFSQIPLTPAYAITSHKSQGKTLDRVHVDIERAFVPGQIYVALSRVRKLSDITKSKSFSRGDIKRDHRLEHFLKNGEI